MEDQPSSANSQHHYQSAQWSRLIWRNTLAVSTPSATTIATRSPPQASEQIDLLPILLPQTTSFHQVQLAQYNRLISSGRSTRLQSPPLPPLLSAQHIQAVPGQRSSLSNNYTDKKHKPSIRGGHGNKEARKYSKGERALMTEKETSTTMPPKKLDLKQLPAGRPLPPHQHSNFSTQSNSVPSTPHQRPRKLSFESRDPSPNQVNNHSPRSAYSESNITLPSSRPHPSQGRCIYETAMAHTRRRMPYSIGSERLEQLKDTDIKSKLSEDEERRLSTDMRELYDRLLPTPESENKRKALVVKLEKLFNDEWPGRDICVHVFGSSGNLLCTDESDVDICITTEWKELESVCKIAALLAKNGMEQVICVSTAKVPIVKIFDPELKLHCDMNVNNTLALENTRMIKTYVEIDPRVRSLAMIIKHWTKRRVVNDAAFGGTLSSYTWICMIINFLQSRNPALLPALHQRQHMKIPREDGSESTFADDVKALQNCGNKNNSSLGELLFHFFRFYCHEFDYDKLVISVRNGRQISKVEKKWHLATNNMLCVEEPFNNYRNLGNTADDTSFRGLHMELRRAFDFISKAKLDACCEEFIFPKEEERVWEKPAPKPKPTLTVSRNPSQSSRGGRGGQRGGRNNHNFRSGNNSRRASAGTFENNPSYVPPTSQTNLSSQEWLQQQAQAQLHNQLYATYSVLQAQENQLRMHLYSQNVAEAHAQAQAQYNQIQGRQGSSPSAKQQATDRDRNRTASFDQAPLTAPIRPEMYFYPLQYQGSPVYGYQTSSTNPSSPSMSSAVPELRRSVHRTSVTNGSGVGAGQSTSSLRSHSQPARSAPAQLSLNGAGLPSVPNGLGIYQPVRQANGVTIPNFIADENCDPVFDAPLPTSRSYVTASPEEVTSREYVGYYVNNDSAQSPRIRRDPIPTFGEFRQSPRRLSTDQLPPSILDRLKRSSRSPSPLGHDRAKSTGTYSAPLKAASSQQGISNANIRALNSQAPLVVNGSTYTRSSSISNWQRTLSGSTSSEDHSSDAALASNSSTVPTSEMEIVGQITPTMSRSPPRDDLPLVVNGSAMVVNGSTSTNEPASIPPVYSPAVVNGFSSSEHQNGSVRLSPTTRSRIARQMQNGGVSPLDIGASPEIDLSNLSPVYETRTPSPTASRKFDPSNQIPSKVNGTPVEEDSATPKPVPRLTPVNGVALPQPISNGHTRAARSEGSGLGTWQKISKTRKKGLADINGVTNGQIHGEKVPSNEMERKGG